MRANIYTRCGGGAQKLTAVSTTNEGPPGPDPRATPHIPERSPGRKVSQVQIFHGARPRPSLQLQLHVPPQHTTTRQSAWFPGPHLIRLTERTKKGPLEPLRYSNSSCPGPNHRRLSRRNPLPLLLLLSKGPSVFLSGANEAEPTPTPGRAADPPAGEAEYYYVAFRGVARRASALRRSF